MLFGSSGRCLWAMVLCSTISYSWSASTGSCPQISDSDAGDAFYEMQNMAVARASNQPQAVSLWQAFELCDGGLCTYSGLNRDDPAMGYFWGDWISFATGASADKLNALYDRDPLSASWVAHPSSSSEVILIPGFSKIAEALEQGTVSVNIGGEMLSALTVQQGSGNPLDITYNSMVSHINTSAAQRVLTVGSDFHACDHAIVTVPLGVLKQGTPTFQPALSSKKQAAIAGIGVGVTNKLFMLFESVFWDSTVTYFGLGQAGLTSHGLFFKFLNVNLAVDRPVLVGIVAGGDASATYEAMTDDEAWSSARTALVKIFGESTVPTQKPTLLRSAWASNPYARGAYSHNTLSTTAQMWSDIAESEGANLHFAGEHTTKEYRGTMHGAFLEGQRAARAVLDAVMDDAKSTSVCVVGAGLSGLSAARTLKDNWVKGSVDLKVFEAAERFGGRVYTQYDAPGWGTIVGAEAELGAGWIHSHSSQHPISKIHDVIGGRTLATTVNEEQTLRLHACGSSISSTSPSSEASSAVLAITSSDKSFYLLLLLTFIVAFSRLPNHVDG